MFDLYVYIQFFLLFRVIVMLYTVLLISNFALQPRTHQFPPTYTDLRVIRTHHTNVTAGCLLYNISSAHRRPHVVA